MSLPISVYIDLLRFLAALLVYLFHASYFSGVKLPLVGNLGSEAVMIFFVLSGFVIAYATDKRHTNLRDFWIARFSRLWSVVLPALLVTLTLDVVGQAISMQSYAPMQAFTPFKWVASIIANALFVNQIWNLSIWPGTNGPFWSLSYEFWYYVIFAAAFYFRGLVRIALVACAAAIAGPKILAALPIWCMGVGIYTLLKAGHTPNKAVGWSLWLGSLVIAIAWNVLDFTKTLQAAFPLLYETALRQNAVNFWPRSYLIGMLVAANIYGFHAVGKTIGDFLQNNAQAIRRMADTSFGLYLLHYPMMYFFKAVLSGASGLSGLAYVVPMYIAPFACCFVLALWCEKKKYVIATVLKGQRA